MASLLVLYTKFQTKHLDQFVSTHVTKSDDDRTPGEQKGYNSYSCSCPDPSPHSAQVQPGLYEYYASSSSKGCLLRDAYHLHPIYLLSAAWSRGNPIIGPWLCIGVTDYQFHKSKIAVDGRSFLPARDVGLVDRVATQGLACGSHDSRVLPGS